MENKKTAQTAVEFLGSVPNDADEEYQPTAGVVEMIAGRAEPRNEDPCQGLLVQRRH
ncbi:MAG TPA: hypothetical protein VMV69_13695 [Pirellulales bacterium]|nr:hypothetical protein [Pirellulales bacterium]